MRWRRKCRVRLSTGSGRATGGESMTKLNHLVVSVAALAATAGIGLKANAGVNISRNGVTWDATYEGDVAALTDSSPAWAVFDVANSNGATSDGITRTHITSNEAGANSYAFAGASWTGGGTQRTAEIRARVPADGQYE